MIAVDGGDCDCGSLILPPPPRAALDAHMRRRGGDHGLWVRDDQDVCDGIPAITENQGYHPGSTWYTDG